MNRSVGGLWASVEGPTKPRYREGANTVVVAESLVRFLRSRGADRGPVTITKEDLRRARLPNWLVRGWSSHIANLENAGVLRITNEGSEQRGRTRSRILTVQIAPGSGGGTYSEQGSRGTGFAGVASIHVPSLENVSMTMGPGRFVLEGTPSGGFAERGETTQRKGGRKVSRRVRGRPRTSPTGKVTVGPISR